MSLLRVLSNRYSEAYSGFIKGLLNASFEFCCKQEKESLPPEVYILVTEEFEKRPCSLVVNGVRLSWVECFPLAPLHLLNN